jgi:asparagine synthase (glutamine-hydrolysing)
MTTQLLKENNIKQLIVGDGGDEVFATADDVAFFERIQTLPYKWRKRLLSLPLKIDLSKITYLNDLNNLPNKYQKLLRILSAPNIPQMVKIRNLLFREDELQRMIQDYHTAPITSFESIHFSGHQESVDEIIGSYFKSTMIDGELVKSKSATAYQGINVKTPYLNHQLIKYMAKVPASVKIKNGIKKHILKEIVHEYIPQKLLDRSKHGFNIPFASWMNNELKELLYAQINEERLKKDCLFTPSSILLIRDKFYAGHESYKYKLWRIFLFQLWYENYQNKTRKR